MATTREVRYTTSGTYDWQPSSISTSAVETTSPHYWTGVPTSLQTDWTTTSSTRRTRSTRARSTRTMDYTKTHVYLDIFRRILDIC